MPRQRKTVNAQSLQEPEVVPPVPEQPTASEGSVKKSTGRGRKRKAETPAPGSVEAPAQDAEQPPVSAADEAPTAKEPVAKRARNGKKSKATAETAEPQPMETAPASAEKKPTPREFVFMEQKEEVWYDTKWHYTQKRPNDASQAGTKAIRRYLKRNKMTKTETPIALRERLTNNMYFYNGELIPLDEPKEIQRTGPNGPVKPYFVSNKVTCSAPEGLQNPCEITFLGRGKGYKTC